MSAHEDLLALHLRAVKLPFERQYKFDATRQWAADFLVGTRTGPGLIVEIEGAKRGAPGRHQRIDGMERDCEKYAAAMIQGYKVLRVMPSQVRSGEALRWIEQIIGQDP